MALVVDGSKPTVPRPVMAARPSRGERSALDVIPVPRVTGALLFRPAPHTDERGFFSRTFDADIMRAAGIDPCAFVQDSVSRSAHGVVRGLHVRSGAGEAKLVRCSYGAIFDVIVDLRPDSPTFGNWESFDLRDTPQISVYVPAGCAHGFQALTDPADVSYRIDRPHDPTEDVSIAFDDPDLAVPWPRPASVRSARDRAALSLADALRVLARLRVAQGSRLPSDVSNFLSGRRPLAARPSRRRSGKASCVRRSTPC